MDNPNLPQPNESGKISLAWILVPGITCLISFAVGFSLGREQSINYSPYAIHDDTNGDGKSDAHYHYDQNFIVRSESDRNHDRKIDSWEEYQDGRLAKQTLDENFDGAVDVWHHSTNGVVVESRYDTDFNGVPDYWAVYQFGQQVRVISRPNASPRPLRIGIGQHNMVKTEYEDNDQDGLLEIKIQYDPFGNISSSNLLEIPLKADGALPF